MQRVVTSFAKVAIPVLIISWLVYRLFTENPDELNQLLNSSKNWPRLAAAITVYLTLVILTFVRWYLLIRSLQLPFKLRDAIRLGFIGYLMQFVSLGAVGGDLFKAIFIAREQPHRKPEAIATILIDRVVGVLGLLILSSVVIFWFPTAEAFAEFAQLKAVFVGAAAIGCTVFLLLLFTKFSPSRWLTSRRFPRAIRDLVLRMEASIRLYRDDRWSVVGALALAVLTHAMHGVAIYLAATACFPASLGLAEHMLLWTVSGAVGALPIAPGGLGTFELAYGWLYEQMAQAALANEGVLVALLYRIMTVITAAIGIAVYLTSRRELQAALTQPEIR